MSDASQIGDLIAKTTLKDRAAFAELYNLTSAKLFGVCLRVLQDRNEAEDVLQEVYVRIWNKADRYAVTGHSPMTWLITIARNLAIDKLRARPKSFGHVNDALNVADPSLGPEGHVIAKSEYSAIVACLGELDADRANAVRGAYLNGDSYDDLARSYDVPVNTMRTWLRRSLMKLKDCLSR